MAKDYIWWFGGFSFLLHLLVILTFLPPMSAPSFKPTEKVVTELSILAAEKMVIHEEPVPTVSEQPKPVAAPAPKPNPKPITQPLSQQSRAPAPVAAYEEVTESQAPAADYGEVERQLRANYVNSYFGDIHRAIVGKLTYPDQAKRRGMRGKVLVKFTINNDGTVSGVDVENSSGHKILDEAGIKAVYASAPFPKPPVPAQIVVPIDFRLN